MGGTVFRSGPIAAGLVILAACAPASPLPPAPTASASHFSTSTPFLPRGFSNVPTSPAALGPPPPEAATDTPATGLDLALAVARLNLLRAQDGAAGLVRNPTLERIAQDRAEALAETRSVWHVPSGGQVAAAESALREAGFGGKVAELALAIDMRQADPLGAILQTLLTDSSNRSLALDPEFRDGAFGHADGGDVGYVVVLLVQSEPEQ